MNENNTPDKKNSEIKKFLSKKNSVTYLITCIKSLVSVNNDIDSKRQKIACSEEQLKKLKTEKEKSDFKWYQIKERLDFNDDFKTEKEKFKLDIKSYSQEIKDLEKQKDELKNKIKKLSLINAAIAIIAILCVTITVGSIREKYSECKNDAPTVEDFELYETDTTEEPTTTEQTTSEQTETEKEVITTQATELSSIPTTTNPTETETIAISTEEPTTEKSEMIYNEVEEPTAETTSRSQRTVYGSRTGNHYHNAYCRYANGRKLTIEEAERIGWEPCKVCNP